MSKKIKEKLKKNWLVITTLGISTGILVYSLFCQNGIMTLGNIIAKLRVGWVIATLAAVIASWLLEGFVLHIIVKHIWKDWDYSKSYNIGMVGVLYSAITPSATGGQPMQIITMHNMGMDTGVACSAIAIKTLTYQIVMVLYAVIMVIAKLKYFQVNVNNFAWLTVVGIFGNVIFIAVVFMFMVSKKITDRILRFFLHIANKMKLCRNPDERYEQIHSQLALFHNASKRMGKSGKLYLIVMAFTTLQITLTSLIPYFIYRSFGLRGAKISIMIAAQVFVAMISSFVPLPGSTGGAEGCFYIFFGPYFKSGIWPAIIVWRFVTYYLNILVGAASVWWSNKYIKNKKMREKAVFSDDGQRH